MNNTNLIGRITKDPEIRYLNNGVANCIFTLAVPRTYKDASGQTPSDFIPCVAFKSQAEFISKYVVKGNLLAVTGSIQTRSYQTQQGENRAVVEVLVNSVSNLSPKDTSAPTPNAPKPKINEPQYNSTSQDAFDVEDDFDSLPF